MPINLTISYHLPICLSPTYCRQADRQTSDIMILRGSEPYHVLKGDTIHRLFPACVDRDSEGLSLWGTLVMDDLSETSINYEDSFLF